MLAFNAFPPCLLPVHVNSNCVKFHTPRDFFHYRFCFTYLIKSPLEPRHG